MGTKLIPLVNGEQGHGKYSGKVSGLLTGFHSFRYVPRSGIGGSYDISVLSLLRNHHPDSKVATLNLHPTNHVRIPLILSRICSFIDGSLSDQVGSQ